MRVLCCLLLFLPLLAPAQDWSTEAVFARHQDAVVQVRIIDAKGGAKRSIGSGFLISDDGQLISNFHVVSDFVNHPGEFRAEWHTDDGSNGELELLDVDVVHDLALLRGEALANRKFLAVESNLPKMGERIFSLGVPYDLGLTIVEGNYNGLLEKSLYERIHLTASINPGMSGGPAIDRFGNVIGVNVASAGDQVSFLVPSSYVIGLLTREPNEDADLFARIGEQLIANQRRYLGDLTQAPFVSTRLGAFEVPGALARYVNCWSQTDQDDDRLVDHTELSCQSEDDVYLSDELTTGALRFEHELMQARDIGSRRFWAMMERHFAMFYGSLGGSKETMTEFYCQSDFVAANGLKSKLILCVRGYRDFTGLYDVVQRLVSVDSDTQALQSTLVLTGVDRELGLDFARRFVAAIAKVQP